jgi:hypothetical protein
LIWLRCGVLPLSPALSLREREKANNQLRIVPSPYVRGRKPNSSLSLWERVRERGIPVKT